MGNVVCLQGWGRRGGGGTESATDDLFDLAGVEIDARPEGASWHFPRLCCVFLVNLYQNAKGARKKAATQIRLL